MITWQKIRTGWLKARIAYHRRKAESFNSAPVIRSFKRDGYAIWMRNVAMHHSMKAHRLERRLAQGSESAIHGGDVLAASLEGRRS